MKDKTKTQGQWNIIEGVKKAGPKLWDTIKKNPWKSILTATSLLFPPIGTAIGASIIGSVVGKKIYETYDNQQETPKTKLGFLSNVKATSTKIFSAITKNPWKSTAIAVGTLIYPIGTAISAGIIAGFVAKKSYEAQNEHQEAQKLASEVRPQTMQHEANKEKMLNVGQQNPDVQKWASYVTQGSQYNQRVGKAKKDDIVRS